MEWKHQKISPLLLFSSRASLLVWLFKFSGKLGHYYLRRTSLILDIKDYNIPQYYALCGYPHSGMLQNSRFKICTAKISEGFRETQLLK